MGDFFLKFRWKILILLLAVSLAPLIIISASHYITTMKLGNRLASDTHNMLTETAHDFLLNLVDDYSRVLNLEKELLEAMLNMQAREITRLLSKSPLKSPTIIYSQDYDKGFISDDGMIQSKKHYRRDPFGNRSATPVTYKEQVYFLVKGTNHDAVAADMARLSDMPEFFQTIFKIKPELILWQNLGLESGVQINYPGAGGFPFDFDQKKRDWYRMAKQAGRLVWGPPVVDALTQITVLTLSKPFYYPDGSFAGVTAIDVLLSVIFEALKLPDRWESQAKIALVTKGSKENLDDGKLPVIAHKGYLDLSQNWQTPVDLEYLESDDPDQLTASIKAALDGKASVRKMGFKGQSSLWAFGAPGPGNTFPVVIVPYETIIAQATETKILALKATRKQLVFAGLILIFAILSAAFLAFLISQRITGPISQLSAAAIKLAKGDYQAKVEIRTRDELQKLGKTFNKMGDELKRNQVQLVQADKMSSLGVLVAGMAHEINNPTSLILLNIRQLQRAWRDIGPLLEEYFVRNGDFEVGGLDYSEIREDIPELLLETQDRAERIKRIVHDLKDYSQQDRRPRIRSIDLNEVANVAIRLVDNSIKKHTTRFSVFLAENLPSFKGTARRIEQIVVNLLLNACQVLERDDQKITLRTGFLEKSGELILEVVDEGRGIAPEHLRKLTDPFFTTRREQGGTGLGLFVSNGIAAEHGGRIEFDSKLGKGTRVRLILPQEEQSLL